MLDPRHEILTGDRAGRRSDGTAKIEAVPGAIDGTDATAVFLMTGLSVEELNDLGGLAAARMNRQPKEEP